MTEGKKIIELSHYFNWCTPVNSGLERRYTLRLSNPAICHYNIEDSVTNGLGYIPVSELWGEKHKDTPYGLIEHLANMDKTLLCKASLGINISLRSLMSKYDLLNREFTRFVSATDKENQIAFDLLGDILAKAERIDNKLYSSSPNDTTFSETSENDSEK